MLASVLIALFAVTACAGGSGTSGDDQNSSPPAGRSESAAPQTPSQSPAPGFTENLTPLPSGTAALRELRGTVTPGVEAGCLLLNASDGVYLLVGGDRQLLVPGRSVVVTGVVKPHLVTICQQGTPFQVASVQPA